ncbi:MAG: EVE domain-containing protein, partial [Burkholderiaceae bacterium]
MMKHWIAVASAEHVAIGRAQGFMQVCHGKAAPLRRLSAGDTVIYYSPVERFGGKTLCQSFT